MRLESLLCIVLLGMLVTNCSTTKMAANQTTSILVQATPAYDRETNLEFAEQAIAGNLKMLEGLLEVTPDNSQLLLLTSSSFARYTFGFMEERIDLADEQNDFEEKQRLIAQAVNFYERAKKYGLRLIAQSRKQFHEVLKQDLEQLSLELHHFKKQHVPALFWTAFAWGNIINLQQDEPEQLVNLPKVELMMQRVLDLDEEYFYGGPHLFYGVYYGSRPEMLGGDLEKANQHFQRAIEISNGKYLPAKFLFVKYYAVPVQDRELFQKTLTEITAAPTELFPEQGLANQLAKRCAARWIKRIDELFF